MEEYRTIQNFENYSISNFGNVKNNTTGRILKPFFSGSGYKANIIVNDQGRKKFNIHRWVGKMFLNNFDESKDIDHIDRNKLNNRIENLRWCDRITNLNNR